MFYLIIMFEQFKKHLISFLLRKDGASAIEYAVLVAMVALVLIGLMSGFNGDITAIFNKISAAINPPS